MGMSRFKTMLRAGGLVVCIAFGLSAPARADNLADALIGAYNTSGLLEQNRALLRAADEDVASSLAALRPVVDYVIGVSRSLSETRTGPIVINNQTSALSASLSASWLLWDNGASPLRTQAAKETVLATRALLRSVEQQVLLRAVRAYMNVLRETEFVSLRQNNVRVLTEELRATRDRFEVGEVTRTDVALAESRLAEARSNLALAEGNLVNAREEYLAAVGRLPTRLQPPPRLPARPASVDEAKAVAMRTHPDIQQAQHQVAAAELGVLATEAGMGPALRLQGQIGTVETNNATGDSNSSSLSLNFSQRIYQGGGLASGLRRAMAQRDAARYALLNVQEAIAQDVASALVRFQVAQATIEANDRRIAAAQVAFRGVREEAALGARTTLDVLDAEQELLDAQTARIAAQTELYVASYQILAAQGLLTAENLRLAVQIYDPAAYFNQVRNAPAYRSQQGQQLDKVLRKLGRE
ncbi:MAG: transporter [Rhodobacteraceae bacterium]|nr:MAG: transporter [Paracoccaceae bacterium]